MEVRAHDAVLMWPYPEARAVLSGGRWLLDLGQPGAPVLPADVKVQHPRDVDHLPARLSESLHDVVDHLQRAHFLEDPEDQVRHLAEHFKRYGPVDVCAHGRPVWHSGRPDSHACQEARSRRSLSSARLLGVHRGCRPRRTCGSLARTHQITRWRLSSPSCPRRSAAHSEMRHLDPPGSPRKGGDVLSNWPSIRCWRIPTWSPRFSGAWEKDLDSCWSATPWPAST